MLVGLAMAGEQFDALYVSELSAEADWAGRNLQV